MARANGGRIVAEGLVTLREELENYFGSINELKEGLVTKVPDLPEAYRKLQQCEALGLPLYEGGVMDQPHIWLLEVGIIREVQQVFRALEERKES